MFGFIIQFITIPGQCNIKQAEVLDFVWGGLGVIGFQGISLFTCSCCSTSVVCIYYHCSEFSLFCENYSEFDVTKIRN